MASLHRHLSKQLNWHEAFKEKTRELSCTWLNWHILHVLLSPGHVGTPWRMPAILYPTYILYTFNTLYSINVILYSISSPLNLYQAVSPGTDWLHMEEDLPDAEVFWSIFLVMEAGLRPVHMTGCVLHTASRQ